MGVFAMNHNSHIQTSHCHSDTPSTPNSKSDHNMNCCELFTSNHYSQVNLKFASDLKTFTQHIPQNICNTLRFSILQNFDF